VTWYLLVIEVYGWISVRVAKVEVWVLEVHSIEVYWPHVHRWTT
jgi:hypothetical protein